MKTPVQKGKIIANPPTLKSMSVAERDMEDSSNRRMRKAGQTMEYKTPKKKIR